ncbi:flavodoxin family protein [Kribbella antibiotica]|uniref:Flavodoxin family protein n=1 Tax=Kribbella antibiotica TaxID=190195 RepID=A0A4R4ZP69_9ACTN|nr:flavodoxin family protein [Kribbella antibiotica]
MQVLVVYESMFGNTEMVAEAIADGLRAGAEVELVEVGAAPAKLGSALDLLVVGGPTHAFGMTRPSTRTDASTKGPVVMSPDIGMREWIGALADRQGRVTTATFDTRMIKGSRLPGSAARGAARLLRRRGFPMLVPPESFYVEGVLGSLLDGETGRAQRWGKDLQSAVSQLATSPGKSPTAL